MGGNDEDVFGQEDGVTLLGSSSAGAAGPKGKAKAKGKARVNRTAKEPCLCCDQPRKSQTRFCDLHRRTVEQMYYQARQQGQEAQKLMSTVLNDDDKAREAVSQFALDNPPDQKHKRKKLIEWASYLKKHYIAVSSKDKWNEKPMTKQAFKAHCEGNLGLTEVEWQGWWQELLDDPNVERDNEGFRGRLQLWIPLGKERERARETGIANELHQGSRQIKNANDKDIQVLKDHAHRQKVSFGDDFIVEGSSKSSRKRPMDEEEEEEGHKKTEGEDSLGRKKRRKSNIDVQRDVPKLYKTMKDNLEKLKKSMDKVDSSLKKSLEELTNLQDKERVTDPALLSYMKMLQHRAQVYLKFKNSDEILQIFGSRKAASFAPVGANERFAIAPTTPQGAVPMVVVSPASKTSSSGFDVTPSKLAPATPSSSSWVPSTGSSSVSCTAFSLTEQYVRKATFKGFVKD